jgi:very-short-patch-repair endonuclease
MLRIAGQFAHTPEAEHKRHETLKRTGKLFSSQPEERLHELLVERFGVTNVDHHVIVSGFRIDFYIHNVKTYVQLDGAYWHGLNQPYEQLIGTPKTKYDRDRKCDAHFHELGLRLIRITDVDLAENEHDAIQRITKGLCSSTS